MMLYPFSIIICNFVINSYDSKEFSQNLVSIPYTFSYFNSFIC